MEFASHHRLRFLFGLAICIASTSAAAVTYRVTDLGLLAQAAAYGVTGAYGVNNAGQIAGEGTDLLGNWRAVLWTRGIGWQELGILEGYAQNSAIAINSGGHIAGTNLAHAPPIGNSAFRWSPAGGMVTLPPLRGDSESTASAINDADQVAGTSVLVQGGSYASRAVVWTAEGTPINLGPGYATGISNLGQVVGWESGAGAFVWTPGQGLTTFGQVTGARARDINDFGQVVGTYWPQTGVSEGFLWTATGGIQSIGALPGTWLTEPRAINDSGVVVGNANLEEGGVTAFIWTVAGGMVALDDLLDPHDPARGDTFLLEALDVNEAGQIAANALIGGRNHGVLLTPVPEPGTLALLAVGLLGLGARARRAHVTAAA